MFQTTEQITKKFIKDGWSKDISFEEFSLEEAKLNGYTYVINQIMKGKKFFRMNVTNNIYNDKGKIVMFDFSICK